MKKFFRMVSMFVLAGATLAYTGCTDYDEDIEAINDRIDKLETGKLKTVEEQVASLTSTVSALQDAQSKAESAIAALQSSLSALESKHDADIKALEEAYKAADTNLKTSIENQIKTLTDQFNAKVTEINTAISGLQTSVNGINTKISGIEATIKTLATKEYVDATFATKKYAEATFATKKEVEEVEKTLGELSARLEIAEKAISTIKGQISDLQEADKKLDEAVKAAQKAADDAQTAADKAQGTAEAALSTANALVEALGAYSVQGALEAKIAALMAMDHELDSTKFNTADFHDTFTTEFDAAIEAALANGGVINEEIASQVKTAREALEKKIDDVKKALDARIDKVLGVIEGRLTSIAFVPQYYVDGVPAILFETIVYDALDDKDEDEVKEYDYYSGWNDSSWANDYESFASALATAKYRLNPRNVGADCADFSFVGDKADYVFTRAEAPEAPVSVFGTPSYDAKTGYVIFQVKKNEKINLNPADEEWNDDKDLDIVALKAVLKKGLTENEEKEGTKPEVYSEYAHVNEVAAPASALAISDKELLEAYEGAVALDETEIPVEEFEFINGHEYAKTFTAAKEGGYVYAMPYDKDFDLGSLVATCFTIQNWTDGLEGVSDHEVLDLEKFGFTYKFSVAQTEFNVTDLASTYNQQDAIECTDAAKGIFRATLDSDEKPITANVGRTPIVRVDLMHGENIVTRAFIKLVITGEREENMIVYDEVQDVVLACPDTKIERAISEGVLDSLYDALHITEAEFWDVYGVKEVTTTVQKNGEDNTVIPAPVVTATAKSIEWSMTHEQAGKIGNGAKIVTTVTVYDKRVLSALPAEIKFQFEVNFTLPKPDPTAEIKDIYWKGGALQANVNVPLSKTDIADNCYFKTPIAIQPWNKLFATNLPCAATDKYGFRISRVYNIDPTAEDGWSKWTATSGVSIETTGAADVIAADAKEYYIVLDKTNEALKKALNSDKGLMAEVQWYVTAQSGDEWVLHTFLVNFIRPLDFILPDGLEVTDAITGGDVVAFQDKTMLKDWRGELVFGPTFEDVLKTSYIWNKVCSPANHAQWQPAYTIEKTPATFEVKTQSIKLDDAEVYYVASYQLYQNAEVIAWFEEHGDAPVIIGKNLKIEYRPTGTWETVEVVTGEGRTENEAKANARAAVNQLNAHYLDGRTSCGYSAEFIGTESKIATPATEITVVTEVKYTPATYETVEGYFVYSPCNEQPGPAMNGEVYTEGQRIGCWQYQRVEETLENQEVDPGQYWNFYGPIDEYVTLDTEKVYTDLPDKKLPAGATLVQSGNTVKYVNVMSPIQYSYHIYIPATIKYGWGTLNQTLVIKANPVGTVAE